MRLPNICGLLTASALLIGANSATALPVGVDVNSLTELTLFITDGTTEVLISDSDDMALDGAIVYTDFIGGDFASFSLIVTTGQGDLALAGSDPLVAKNDLVVSANRQGVGDFEETLTIELIDPNLSIDSQSNPVLGKSEINLNSGALGSASAQSFISVSADPIGDFADDTGVAVSENDELRLAALTSTDTFILTSIVTLTSQKFNDLSGSIDTTVQAIPLPAALPLFLTGLVGLGFVGRRQRRRQIA